MSRKEALLAAVLVIIGTGNAAAAVSPEEAKRLHGALTPLGGERAGSADGLIPPWTGGMAAAPAGYVTGAPRPDPVPGESPRLTIAADNVAAEAARLPQGALELFKRYPAFRMEVFPTHRTAMAPASVYDATFANATSARTTQSGNTLEGARGGIPFPIPRTGNEALWNALVHWQGVATSSVSNAHLVTANGRTVLEAGVNAVIQHPYYQDAGIGVPGAYELLISKNVQPAYLYGQAAMAFQMLDPIRDGTPGWQYLVGQRRVRKAPNLGNDTPNFVVSGIVNFDEFGGFHGPMDKFTWKLLGKRELYVPYNENKLTRMTSGQILQPGFPSPDALRWELHRVWAVEGDLAPGERHVVHKRVLYLDEDTWQILCADEYDASGALWKFIAITPYWMPEFPVVDAQSEGFTWDFHLGAYLATLSTTDDPSNIKRIDALPEDYFTPDSLAARGTR